MAKHDNSLQGYGEEIYSKYNCRCQYCGYDGRTFLNWLQLTVDHIRPRSGGGTDSAENLICACHWCNSSTSRMKFGESMSTEDILAEKRRHIRERQTEFLQYWLEHVMPKVDE